MNFKNLVDTIQITHSQLQRNAIKSINKHLTIRNWLIGFYIVEFEQNGSDRATYGEKLLLELAKEIKIKGLSETSLNLNRQFYRLYPQIVQTVSEQLQQFGLNPISQLPTEQLNQFGLNLISQTPSEKFTDHENQPFAILQEL